jgi:DNA-binding response OmpR family regulator
MKTKNTNHILVIDDDDFLLNAVRKKLEGSGYKVTVSNNVHDAYFKLSILKPDLILLDIIMPEINGIEFMNLINTQLGNLTIPIMLMSYLPEQELYHMGYNIGQARYLAKPFNINNLPFILNRELLAMPQKIKHLNHH